MNRVDKIATRRRRQGAWLSTCAMATALAVSPHSARAQAFQGTPTVVTGSAGITTGSGTTAITVAAPETVINWTPTDTTGSGTIDFLPAGTTATFDAGRIGSYTVLNRILPTDATGAPTARMVGLNGTVNSLVPYCPGTCSFIPHVPGGNVWFYTPTGFVIGPTATMTVGGLILTTDDIQFTPNDPASGSLGSIYGPGGVIQFRGPAGSTGLIDVQAGAQLNAVDTPLGNSYIAMVAPRIQQAGTVSAERSVGYIAAEQADLTINAGLFDISILAGTTDSNGIVHTGTTTGSQSSGSGDVKQVFFVALPKTTALTMLLSGSVGYTPAASAANDGSSVVLSSGYDAPAPTAIPSAPTGDISIGNTVFNNPLHAFATGKITIQPSAGNTQFLGDASLLALDSIVLNTDTGAQITAPNMYLSAGIPGAGGNIVLLATGKSAININGTLDLDATTQAQDFLSGSTGDGVGGNIDLDAAGGIISAGYLRADATGYGAYDTLSGGKGQGGSIALATGLGGTLAAPTLILDADGYGGGSDTAGGDGIGGVIGINESGGALNFGTVALSVEAAGGGLAAGGMPLGPTSSGNATGGAVALGISSQAQSWNSLTVDANVLGGFANPGEPVAGSATGRADAISLQVSGPGSLSVAGNVNLTANAYMDAGGPAGYSGRAGGIAIVAGSGLTIGGTLAAYANAEFADVADGSPQNSASMHGGSVSVIADGGTINAAGVDIQANATGNYASGGPGSAGSATGGSATVEASGGGTIKIDDGTGKALLSISASALGTSGASPANALGGTAQLQAVGGTISVLGDASVVADGLPNISLFGVQNGQGASATGGNASVQVGGSTGLGGTLSANNLIVEADGDAGSELRGGPVVFGDGGLGKGGNAALTVDAGTLTVGNVNVTARGYGGVSEMSGGPTAFRSGNGTGGVARVAIGGGTSTIANLMIAADGNGGSNSTASGSSELGPLAGDGSGGFALLRMGNGALSANALTIESLGQGGAGTGSDVGGVGTNGGNGTGGTAAVFYDAGATGNLTSANALILAGGEGGDGGSSPGGTDGNGGNGIGGAAGTEFADGAFNLTSLIMGADGGGGAGTVGGNGSGGTTAFSLIDTTGPSGARSIGSLSLYADGVGAAGSVGPNDAGSLGLTVDTASSGSGITIGGDLTAEAIGDTSPAGNGFTADISGAPLTVNGNVAITTTRDSVMTGAQPIHATGNLTIGTRQLTVSGPLIAGGNVVIDGLNGVALGALTSGGTTRLMASNGAITTTDLRSAGLVTATGQSLLLQSGAGLTFASATASAGDLQIVTAAGLASNGPVSASGNVKLIGNGGLSAGAVTSGGTTTLRAPNGAITVTDLLSPGLVSASGRSVDINSTGALTFSDAGANAGDLVLRALDLTATGPLFASGNASLNGTNGIALRALSSGGTVDLTASNGAISATDLRTPGIVTANGRSIDIASGGGLTFASATATAGDLGISTALGLSATGPLSASGNVALSGGHGISAGTVTSGGTTSLTAANGVIGITDLTSPGAVSASGESVNLAATGPLTFASAAATGGDLTLTALDLTATGPLSATGNVALDAANGIAVGALTSGGTTGLTSNGAISVSDLNSAGLVSAVGSSLDLTSDGKLSFDTAKATGGNLAIATAGDLAVSNGSATGGVNLSSSGGAISSAVSVSSGGNFDAAGATGLNFTALTSGGTMTLRAPNGALSVGNLQSAGPVNASGRSIAIGSSGGLTFANASATAGDLAIATSGDLSLPTASATGAMTLTSGGTISSNSLTAGSDFAATGAAGIDFASVQSGGTTLLRSLGFPTRGIAPGDVTVTSLTSAGNVTAIGRSVTIGSSGALTFASATATGGNLALAAAGKLAVANGSSTGSVNLSSSGGAISSAGSISSGGNFDAVGATGLNFAALTSGGSTGLRAPNGALSVTDLQSAGLVTGSGRSVFIGSSGGLHFTSLTATAGDLGVSTALGLRFDGNVAATGNVALSGKAGLAAGSVKSGGTASLTAANGAVTVSGLDAAGLVTASGRSINLDSPGALALAGANATAGDLTLFATDVTANGPMSASGNVSISGLNGIAVGSLTSGGTTQLTSVGPVSATDLRSAGKVTASGTSIDIASGAGLAFDDIQTTAGPLRISTAGDLALNAVKAAGALTLASTNGSISAIGDASAGGNARVTAAHGIDLPSLASGGTTLLQSGDGALSVGALTSPGAVTAKGAAITIGSPQGLTFAALDATGALSITAGGALVLPTTSAGGKVTLGTSAGGVTVNGNLSGLDTAIVSPGDVSIGGDLTANGTLLINAVGGFTTTGTVTSGATTIAGGSGVSLATLNSTGAVTLQSPNGDVTAEDIVTPGAVTASGANVTLSSSGGLRLAGVTATAGDIHLAAAGDLLSGGNLSATGQLSVEATGLFTLSGQGTGATILVRSGDIDIGGESRLGARGTTQDIALSTYDAAAPLFIGGSSQGSGYRLDNLEAGRLYADRSITIGSGSGTSPGSGDITLGALTLSYGDGGNLGTGGLLGLHTGGKVTVNGAVQLATSSADDTFSIDPTLIDVVAGQGSIVMQSDPGKPLGTLSLTADTIAVATPATFDAISGLTDLGQISQKLATPAPAGPAGGYLQAGTIEANAYDSLLIQNGGTGTAFADRRGFSASELDITTGSATTQIAINGVILRNGAPVTGPDTIPLVSINGKPAAAGGQFDRLSTINGCVIGNDCSAPQLPPVNDPTEIDLTSPVSQQPDKVLDSVLFSLADNAPLITPPLVDEPITGVGNDDLWVSGCSDNSDDKRCADKKEGD